jgi:hypothetical protein
MKGGSDPAAPFEVAAQETAPGIVASFMKIAR